MNIIGKFLIVLSLSLVTFTNVYSDEILPSDNSFVTYHTSPRYRASEEHPIRIASYLLHPIGWVLRETITRPFSYFMSSTPATRSIFGYREPGDFRTPDCFSSSNGVPDCKSIVPYNYERPQSVSAVNSDNNLEREVFFPNINFDFDSRKLNPLGLAQAENLAKILDESGNVSVVLEGHTDNIGTEEYNNTLGMDRAEAVRSELVRLGVSADMLSTVTFGKSRPLIDEDTASARAANRRVEVHQDK